ncbi:hypothetical protein [Flavobacterium branchiophilum]|uniref:Uncharacterized protein n=1 Tax=Flavobacterium branchiophilum (strain FL-15) TaxID=1034807 RepID=G2Z048_FLABF|nr:hypothetical protein [Flavobacterium branchiophilum]CCB70331.1 Hypothetical protein FBFL15_2311 [Flavobacterium branchiophilum FL-15]
MGIALEQASNNANSNDEPSASGSYESTSNANVNKELKNIQSGKGKARTESTGEQKIFRGDKKDKPGYGSQKKWVGS